MIIKLSTGGTATAVGGSSGAKSGFMNSGAYSAITNTVGGVFDSLPTPNLELNETNSTMANIRSGISTGLMASGNPFTMAAGVALKVIDKTGGFVDASKGLGSTNDTLNAVASLALPGAGWFARRTENYKISSDMKAMASGYASAMKHNQTAQLNAGAKILFGFNKAQSMIHAAKVKDRIISNIKQGADEDMLSAATMTQARAMLNQYDYMGGYNQALARAAKNGAKLEQIIRVKKLLTKPKEIEEFKEGGTLPEEFVPTTQEQDLDFFNNLTFEDPKVEEEIVQPEETVELKEVLEFKEGGKSRRNLKLLIEIAKKQNPRFIQRMSEPLKDIEFVDVEGNKSRGTHYMVDDNGLVYPTIQEMEDGSLKYFENIDEARERAIKNKNYLKFSPEEARDFAENYKEGWPDFFGLEQINGKWYKKDGSDEKGNRYIDYKTGDLYYFKDGGAVNVIPEGNLHARLHHMEDAEGLTKKGVPVVDKDGNLLAEIELNEIILHLELTKKLEELCNKFYSEETKPRDKEDLAIEAGKLLATEIIENTEDRTGLMNEVA